MLGICTVESRAVPGGVSVGLSGQLCYASSPAVRRGLLGILATHPMSRLDLRGLTFIDLSGIDAVRDVLERIGPSERPEVLLGARARRLLELLTRMDAVEDHGRRPAEARPAAAAAQPGARAMRMSSPESIWTKHPARSSGAPSRRPSPSASP